MILSGALEQALVRHGDGGDTLYAVNLFDGSVAIEENPEDESQFGEMDPSVEYELANPLGGLFTAAKSALADLEGIIPGLDQDSPVTHAALKTIAALQCSVAAVIDGMGPEQEEISSTESRGRGM